MEEKVKNIIIIQHCQSEHHINNLTGGWTDTTLTTLGEKQALSIAHRLCKEYDSDEYSIYSSDLLRAQQTAKIISQNKPFSLDTGLREINNGVAISKTKDWARSHRNPKSIEGFDADYREFDQGESWREFYTRIGNTMNSILDIGNDNVIIVSHGCTIGFMTAWWLGYPIEMLKESYFQASPGSISMLSDNKLGQHTLNLFNDASHLNNKI